MKRGRAGERDLRSGTNQRERNENEGEEIGAKGEKSNSSRGFVFSLLPFGIWNNFTFILFCFKRFFIFFLLSWQWLLIFATFSFGFLSCFLHAAAALALFSDAFVVDFLHISADVVLADFSFFFSKKERCILSIEVCVTFCGGKEGLEKRKVAQISQISECER